MTEPLQLDMQAILERLPHRYPFLLVDRVLECRPGHSIRALKNVTYNEPYFPGHFPGRPVMPGVIIIEAMAMTPGMTGRPGKRSEEHTSELQSLRHLVCRLLLEKKKKALVVALVVAKMD